MQLLDDHLFNALAEGESARKEDVLGKAQSPDELAKRIANAERGMFDDEDDDEEGRKTADSRAKPNDESNDRFQDQCRLDLTSDICRSDSRHQPRTLTH